MITFKVKTTTFRVHTMEKQESILQVCEKITRRSGRSKAGSASVFSSSPKYPRFHEGDNVNHYVRAYEALNLRRFGGKCGQKTLVSPSLFVNLSDSCQYSQDDTHIEEIDL